MEKTETPIKCPICAGTGYVSGGFYNSVYGCGVVSTNCLELCRTCNGTGIVYQITTKE